MSSSINSDPPPAGKDAKKFMFDMHDFDLKKKEDEPEEITYSEEEYQKAIDEAHQKGVTAGIQQTEATIAQQTALTLQQVDAKLTQIIQSDQQREAEKNRHITELSLKIAEKMIPSLAQKVAMEEIENMIKSCIDDRLNEPRIAVRLHPSLMPELKEKIDTISSERGYNGQVILLAEENLQITDCKIEWADGGAERLFDQIFQELQTEFLKVLDTLKHPNTTSENADQTEDKNSV